MYIKCIDFHDTNTSHHSHIPHVSSILISLLFLSLKSMYIKCIDFYHNNNHLFLPYLYRQFKCASYFYCWYQCIQMNWFSIFFYGKGPCMGPRAPWGPTPLRLLTSAPGTLPSLQRALLAPKVLEGWWTLEIGPKGCLGPPEGAYAPGSILVKAPDEHWAPRALLKRGT